MVVKISHKHPPNLKEFIDIPNYDFYGNSPVFFDSIEGKQRKIHF